MALIPCLLRGLAASARTSSAWGGLDGMLSPFDPRSPQAAAISRLFVVTLLVCAAIFGAVALAIGYALRAFREREGRVASRSTGHRTLEIAWTLVPLAIVTGLFFLALGTMARADPPADRAPDVVVIGHQWWWEARYPSGAVAANEIHVPAGRDVLVELRAADVIHDFWVPQLGRKMDAIPGHPNRFWLRADAPGAYGGACAEYCGAQHAWMRILVVADAPADFVAWENAQQAAAAAPSGDAATRGEDTFRKQACGSCHAVQGRGFAGGVAPDLTHVGSRRTLGAGATDQTPQDLATWLRDPQATKPGCHMPSFLLSDGQVSDLVAYLEGLP